MATVEPIPSTDGASVVIEAPRINAAWSMNASYRFVYGWHPTRPHNYPNAIAKVDVTGLSPVRRWVNADDEFGVMMGEAVFVARPNGVDEDDGVVVSAGLHIESGRSFALVLNASTMGELARAYAPSPITFGFHTQFYPSRSDDGD
jgi:carotenoid cleavage dioxygenase-like enzyme